EGPGENFFMVKAGTIITPPESSGILVGITRDSIIQVARDLGYRILEREITTNELFSADEAFFTGTAAEVTPIREIDGRIIGEGKRGPITEKLQKTFFDIVNGRNEKYEKWLDFVK
ncbi:MAG: aminotransferase class IV, partial [Candidatus Micrarchaeota archaeon]